MATPIIAGSVVLMLANLLTTNYNIDSTRGLNKAIKRALTVSATPLSSVSDRNKVSGGVLDTPAAINALRTGGFLPPSASASSFPVYLAVGAVGFVVGMILACVVGICLRSLWRRRYERKKLVDERHGQLLTEMQQRETSAPVVPAPMEHSSPSNRRPPPAPQPVRPAPFDPWRHVLKGSLQRASPPPAHSHVPAHTAHTAHTPSPDNTRGLSVNLSDLSSMTGPSSSSHDVLSSHPIIVTPTPSLSGSSPLHSVESVRSGLLTG